MKGSDQSGDVQRTTGFLADILGQIKLIWQMMAGLRSAMSYSDARTIEEFQRVSEFVRVTPLGLRENTPHATTGSW